MMIALTLWKTSRNYDDGFFQLLNVWLMIFLILYLIFNLIYFLIFLVIFKIFLFFLMFKILSQKLNLLVSSESILWSLIQSKSLLTLLIIISSSRWGITIHIMYSLGCSKWIDLISWKLAMIIDTLNNKTLPHLWSITSTGDLLITNSHS